LTLGSSQVTAGKKSAFEIRHKSKENLSASSETKIDEIDEPKVEIVQYYQLGRGVSSRLWRKTCSDFSRLAAVTNEVAKSDMQKPRDFH